MRNEYRVMRSHWRDYEPYYVEIRLWWWPLAWMKLPGSCTKTQEEAEAVALKHATRVVKTLGRLP